MTRGALGLLLAVALACGSGLEGERGGAVADWSFVNQAKRVSFASGSGTPLRLVLVHPLVVDGRLYMRAMTILPLEDPALESILADGAVQVAVDGRIWSGRAVLLVRAEEIDPLLPELLRLSHMEAAEPRWNPTTPRYPGTQVRQWFFQVEVP